MALHLAPPVTLRPGPVSRFFVSQRLKLHYVDWGNVGAPPLVLVHGGRDHCRMWDWVAERLAERWHVIAPDLRGHGDSAWSSDGSYSVAGYLYDLAQLVHQLRLAPATIVAHSLGGNISTRFAGTFPDQVRQMVLIEGLGMSPRFIAQRDAKAPPERLGQWITKSRELAARAPRRYESVEEAIKRMQEANKRLSAEQARHITLHALNQNEDGTFSWKFDPYLYVWPAYDIPQADVEVVWRNITCPILNIYGRESEASDPLTDGRARHFKTARFVTLDGAGHWVHHDRLDEVMRLVDDFLVLPPPPDAPAR